MQTKAKRYHFSVWRENKEIAQITIAYCPKPGDTMKIDYNNGMQFEYRIEAVDDDMGALYVTAIRQTR